MVQETEQWLKVVLIKSDKEESDNLMNGFFLTKWVRYGALFEMHGVFLT